MNNWWWHKYLNAVETDVASGGNNGLQHMSRIDFKILNFHEEIEKQDVMLWGLVLRMLMQFIIRLWNMMYVSSLIQIKQKQMN